MKTALVIGGAALGLYLLWKYAPGGSEVPCGCHGSASTSPDAASMNVDAAASTTFGTPSVARLITPTMQIVSIAPIPRSFDATLQTVIAAEDAPPPALPTPNTDMFASASGQPAVDGTLARQQNPIAPLGARLRLIA
jgi:hypothetical protein